MTLLYGIKTVLLLLTTLVQQVEANEGEYVEVKLSTKRVARTTSDKFLSVTLGSTRQRDGWRGLNLDLLKLRNLARELSPGYLRVGGTRQDYLEWDESGKGLHCYNASQLERLNGFAQNVELDLIFGLAALPRKSDGSWDPTNSLELFQYMKNKSYKMHWELGNEPDRYPVYDNSTNITAEKLAKDFGQLKVLLKTYGKENTMLIGPDVSELELDSNNSFFKGFLESVESGILNAVTYHQYYGDSIDAKLYDFINITKLDGLIDYGQEAVNLVYSTHGESTPVWLGETSSTYNSGAKGYSDSYLAGFMWLDKLGITALVNHSVICRQTFVGGYYSLLDFNSMDPLPDYWTSVLHKRLVGEKVLMVDKSLQPGRKARIYAQCARVTKYYAYEAGAITLMVLNLYPNDTINLRLEDDLKNLNVDQFLLQPGTAEITSKTVKLNGNLLKLRENDQLPDLNPMQVKQPFSIPPLTYGFFVIPKANAEACLNKDVQTSNKVSV